MADTIGRAYPFLYRGYCYDAETGLYYLGNRYYDPQTGRFLNADGAVSTGTGILGYNMFAYCNNDPTGLADNGGSRPMAMSENGIESIEDQIIAAKFYSEAHRKTALAEATMLVAAGKIINRKAINLGKGWFARIDDKNTANEHIHVYNRKKTVGSYAQGVNGKPHDKNKNGPNSGPQKSIKKR